MTKLLKIFGNSNETAKLVSEDLENLN